MIEVKTLVAVDLAKVNAHDVIELLIYCQYIMRIENIKEILGALTDKQT